MSRTISRRSFVGLVVGAAMAGLTGCAEEKEVTVGVPIEEDAEPADEVVESQEDAASEDPSQEQTDLLTGRVLSFDLHADTVDTLCMHDIEPYSTLYVGENHYGTMAESDASVSPSRMGDVGWAQCYAVWTPDDSPTLSHLEFYRRGASYFHEQMNAFPDTFAQITTGTDIRSSIAAGKVAAILTVENSCALEEGIQVVDEFERDGVLVCGLTWNGANAVGGGVNTGMGLTELGREYVAALESRRMVVDISHLSDEGFWDLEQIATRPYIATHSNARSVYGVQRNLTDDQFKAIRDRGGIVGLNFYEGFVGGYGEYGFEELIAHVEHWLDLGGADVVALGSDRDGSALPSWLRDCSSQASLYNQTVAWLGEDQARKLFFDNAADFFVRNATA